MNPIRALRIISVLTVFLAPLPVGAQQPWQPSRAPRPEDVNSIDGIVGAFYDIVSGPAGEPRDWARDSTLYLPGVRYVIVNESAGRFAASVVDHHTFATSSGPALERGFFEREIHRVLRRFGPMVHVFSTYEWRPTENGPVGGRGINSIELFHDGSRWWIASAMWASESPSNPIPAEFLPDGGQE